MGHRRRRLGSPQDRRTFFRDATICGVAAVLAGPAAGQEHVAEPRHTFRLKYAPHFGMFAASAGSDLLEQLRFARDQGFVAWEDNGMPGRSVDTQKKIVKTMQTLEMQMGVFVAHGDFGRVSFAGNDSNSRQRVLQDIQNSVEVAKRVHAKWMTVVPDAYHPGIPWDYQTANCIELLKQCSAILEPHQLVMVLEPLNWWANHPGLFLHKIPQAYQICRAVDSPSCKILFDIYHQQITEGNLIPNIDQAWDEIAYFQCGDNPGRKEPGTGEINYARVFSHIYSKGYAGIVGMEHGNSQPGKAGEQRVLDAYIRCDKAAE